MFSLFDRRDRGYFNFEQFDDIVSENLQPDYLKIAKQAKIRYVQYMNNLNAQPEEEEPEIIVKKVKQERIVPKVVEKIVVVDKYEEVSEYEDDFSEEEEV